MDPSTYYPADNMEYPASINSDESGIFTRRATQIVNRWDDEYFQDVHEGSFCTQLSPLEG